MSNQLKTIILFTVSGAFVVVLAVLLLIRPSYDEQNCLTDQSSATIVVALIDLTDERTTAEHGATQRSLRCLQSTVGLRDRLIVSVLAGSDSGAPEVSEVFNQCRPNNTQDFDSTTQGIRDVEKTWERDWLRPLEAAIERLIEYKPANASPLMESLKVVAKSTNATTFHFFTDLMEHSDRWSGYGSDLNPKLETLSAAGGDIRFYRYAHDRRAQVEPVWDAWLSDSGAQYRMSDLPEPCRL